MVYRVFALRNNTLWTVLFLKIMHTGMSDVAWRMSRVLLPLVLICYHFYTSNSLHRGLYGGHSTKTVLKKCVTFAKSLRSQHFLTVKGKTVTFGL